MRGRVGTSIVAALAAAGALGFWAALGLWYFEGARLGVLAPMVAAVAIAFGMAVYEAPDGPDDEGR